MTPKRVRRRTWLVALAVLWLPACEQGGHFTLWGYSTQPNYNLEIRTVRVPIFKNQTYRKGLEFDLTQAVIREIEWKTPYKVVAADCAADTELLGNIVNRTKTVVNFNQLGEVRDAETTLAVEIVWRDLRAGSTGEVLSQPVQQGASVPPPPVVTKPGSLPTAVLVQSVATFQPELGGSLSTAENRNINRLAEQVVSMMEKGW